MNNRNYHFREILLLVFGIMLLVCSCKKAGDIDEPVVSVLSPSSTVSLYIPDSVLVIADIYDNSMIASVKVVVVNDDRVSVSSPQLFYPGESHFHLELYVKVQDRLLPSGNYYILIYISDGINSKSEYLPVKVFELPRELRGYAVVETAGTGMTRINYLDDEFSGDTAVILKNNHKFSGINPGSQLFYLISTQPSQIEAYMLMEKDPEWIVQASLPFPEFTGIFIDKELITGTANGDIIVYDHGGNILVRTVIEPDRRVEEIHANEHFIVAEMVSINGKDRYLYTYYRQTGGMLRNRKINGDIGALIAMGDDFLVILNGLEKTSLYALEPAEGILTILKDFPDKMILQAVNASYGKVFLNTGEDIYLYDYQLNTLSSFAQCNSKGILFEALQSTLFSYRAEGIESYTYPEGELTAFVPFPGPVLNFQVIYNK